MAFAPLPSYKTPETIEPLSTKLKNAKASLQSLQDNPKFTGKRITVMEVNTDRLYSWEPRGLRMGKFLCVDRKIPPPRKLHMPSPSIGDEPVSD